VAQRREAAEYRSLAVVDEAGLLTEEAVAMGQEEEAAAEPGGELGWLRETVSGRRRAVGGEPPRRLPTKRRAQEKLLSGEIESFYFIPDDYVQTGRVEYWSRRPQFLWSPGGGASPLRPWLLRGLLADMQDKEREARARQPIAGVRTMVLDSQGQFKDSDARDTVSRVLVPFAFAFILMLSIFIASGYLIQGLVEEKSTRVIELLLSSVTPDELIAGKLLGLGSAGLLQLLVWLTLASVPALLLTSMQVSGTVVLVSVLYYLVGFVFFGSVMAGIGCIAGSTHESQQLASLWSVVAVLPMLFSPLILEDPNSVLSRVLSYVPLTSPMTMIMRCAVGKVVWWDVPLSLVVLLGSTYLSIRVSARLFRAGLLMTGQRPTLGELWGYLRA
jgi:ABC-2 type transport system permease protein